MSTRGLVLGCLLPSRPQERFRTWPRLASLGDLENPDVHCCLRVECDDVPASTFSHAGYHQRNMLAQTPIHQL